MRGNSEDIRYFGRFRLDTGSRVLWIDDRPVAIPPKEVDVLCVLTEAKGAVVTKDLLMKAVWADSFVEESNLSRHIYNLRKTFRELGESEGLIETIPRRGYRFTGSLIDGTEGDIVFQKHRLTRTLVEEYDVDASHSPRPLFRAAYYAGAAILILAAFTAGASFFIRGSSVEKPRIRSLAVLPFRMIDTSGSDVTEGAGLADILITRLSRSTGLIIRPYSAVASISAEDPVSAGQKLAVDVVLDGSIYHKNGDLRVTLRLINVSDNSFIWSGQFDRPSQNVFQMQDEIARRVADSLSVNLGGADNEVRPDTKNKDALELYLMGRYEWNRRNGDGLKRAERLFRDAIDKDPEFAEAYVGVADSLIFAPNINEANYLVDKALELNPDLAEAYATRGFIRMFHEWQWDNAEADLKRSIELNPGLPTAHQWYATLLMIRSRPAEAVAELNRAIEIDPLSYNLYADLGQALFFSGEFEKSEAACLKALELYPDFLFAHENLSSLYFAGGDYPRAIRESLRTSRILSARPGEKMAPETSYDKEYERLVSIVDKDGRPGYWRDLLDGINGFGNRNPNELVVKSRALLELGDTESALSELEKASESHAFTLPFVNGDPSFEPLRNHPRFREIMRKISL
jgi:DNA-binding winged helix-turn-helix (wHTH) protein/TolB-like protein/Flp pilus assembly protein TadD